MRFRDLLGLLLVTGATGALVATDWKVGLWLVPGTLAMAWDLCCWVNR